MDNNLSDPTKEIHNPRWILQRIGDGSCENAELMFSDFEICVLKGFLEGTLKEEHRLKVSHPQCITSMKRMLKVVTDLIEFEKED